MVKHFKLNSILTTLIFFLVFAVFAEKNDIKKEKVKTSEFERESSVFQVGIIDNFPHYTEFSNINGLKLGLPMSSGDGIVNGLEFSLYTSSTKNINGVQFALIANEANNLEGVQLGWVNNIRKTLYGLQLFAVNISTGIVNGLQLGIINYTKRIFGLQVGVVNYAKDKGTQIGGINIIENGWLPVTLLFNISY